MGVDLDAVGIAVAVTVEAFVVSAAMVEDEASLVEDACSVWILRRLAAAYADALLGALGKKSIVDLTRLKNGPPPANKATVTSENNVKQNQVRLRRLPVARPSSSVSRLAARTLAASMQIPEYKIKRCCEQV